MAQNITGTISVEDLKLFINKGLYASEALTHNHFLVSAAVAYHLEDLGAGAYLDYTELAHLLRNTMCSDTQLLESIARSCVESIRQKWPFAISVRVHIKKIHPDFEGLQLNAVSVSLKWEK